jgi:hypothetical protein
VDSVAFATPSDAASAIAGHQTNGWAFFLTDQTSRRSLRAVRRDYVNAMAVDVEDDEPDDDGDEGQVAASGEQLNVRNSFKDRRGKARSPFTIRSSWRGLT